MTKEERSSISRGFYTDKYVSVKIKKRHLKPMIEALDSVVGNMSVSKGDFESSEHKRHLILLRKNIAKLL